MTIRARALRNAMFSSVAVYTEFALGLITSIIIARHLGPDGFGAYSAVILMVGVGVAASNSGTATSAIRFVAELRGAGRESEIRSLVAYLRRTQRWFLVVVMLFGGAALWMAGHRVAPSFHHGWLYLFLVLGIGLRASYMFNIGVSKGMEDFRINAMVALVSAPINLALIATAWWLDLEVEWLLGIFLLTGVLFFTMSQIQVHRLLPAGDKHAAIAPALKPRLNRQMFYTTLIVSIGFVVGSEIEVLFLNAFGDPHGAGQFKVGYQLAAGASALVPGVVGALLLPMMAHALSQGREEGGRRFVAATAYLALLAIPLITFGVALSDALIALLYGKEYLSAGTVFAVCLTGTAIAALSQGASSLLISAERQRIVLWLVIIFGASKIGLDAWLIHSDGLRGAMIAFFVVCVVNAAAYMILAIREIGVSPDWSRILRITTASALAAVPVWVLRPHLSTASLLVVGVASAAILYLPLTLAFGCWARGDIEYMQHLFERLPMSANQFGARLLAWAHARSDA